MGQIVVRVLETLNGDGGKSASRSLFSTINLRVGRQLETWHIPHTSHDSLDDINSTCVILSIIKNYQAN
jgi:hypothetical protein